MIERLDMDFNYSAAEAAIHISRYSLTKNHCKDKTILDLSCGEGYGSYLMKRWGAKTIFGIDISEETIEKAKKDFVTDGLTYLCQNAMDLSNFEDNTFDMIVSFETIEHLKEPKKYLSELKRVSKENAIIIISCPNDHFYYPTDNEFNPYHVRKYTKDEFVCLVESTLGKCDNFLLGTRIEGFANIYPSGDVSNKKQIEMLNYKETDQAIIVPESVKVGNDNCSYFVCIWGITDRIDNITANYMSIDDVNKNNIKYILELEKYQKELQSIIEDYKKTIIDLEEKLENNN